jgi:hydroxyacylglutathione hydrolase
MRRLVCLLALAGCAPAPVTAGDAADPADLGSDGALTSDLGGGVTGDAAGPTVGTGTLDVAWIHGAADCAQTTDPPIQVVRFDADTWVLRQSKCVNYEGPFLYLLAGSQRALLIDSGATAQANRFPIAATVRALIPSLPVVVAHTHAHGDHVQGDAQLAAVAGVTVVGTTEAAVKTFFGFNDWPVTARSFDLGGRAVEVLPIPGHERSHVAFYDPKNAWLITGDSLYPGRLYVNDWAAYRASIARLAAFAHARTVSLVLGTHIEMTQTPKVDYPIGTTYQPNEHKLPLALSHLDELSAALGAIGASPQREVHDHFIIDP